MKSTGKKILLLIVVVLLVIYAVIQGISLFSKQVTTEKLVKGTADNTYTTEGLFFRSEHIITSRHQGTVNYNFSDGDKVKTGTVIGMTFSGITDTEIKSRILEIDAKIQQLNESIDVSDMYLSDAVNLELQITNIVTELMCISQNKNLTEYNILINKLQVLLNKKQMVLSENVDFSKQIKELEQERENLIYGSSGGVYKEIAPVSGYFSSQYDGYENIITPDNLDDKDYQDFKAVFDLEGESETPDNYVGKIITDFDWYFGCTVSKSAFVNYNEGDTVNLSFPALTTAYVPTTIDRIESIDDDNLFIIFKSDYYDINIFNLRKSKVNIVLKTYSGYRVNKNAVRMNGESTGIYILSGSQVQFKDVNVLYADDYVAIIVPDSSKKITLLPGEYVVVKGKNLFDGKMVR